MKNSTNFKRKFAFLSLLMSVFVLTLISFVPQNLSVKADNDKNYMVTGSVYAQSGNSDFWLSKGSLYLKVQLYDSNNNFIVENKVDTYGQYVLKFSGDYSVESNFYFKIISGYGSAVYLFNNFTLDYFLSGLIDNKVNYVDLYIQDYLFSTIITNSISNYVPNKIVISGKDGVISSRFGFLDNSLDYLNNFTFDFYVTFNSYIPGKEVPAFWINANSPKNSWLFGCGIYAKYTTSTDTYPWIFYFKDNKSQYYVPIYRLKNSDFSKVPVLHLRYRVALIDDLPYLQIFFDNSFDSVLLSNFTLIYQVSLPEQISNLTLQSFNVNASLQYSYFYNNRSYVQKDYANIYNDGYSKGKIDGENVGYTKGFSDGANSDSYTFNSLISALVNVPVQFITNLFDVEILGVNLKFFIFSIASLFILTALIKFFVGKLGD